MHETEASIFMYIKNRLKRQNSNWRKMNTGYPTINRNAMYQANQNPGTMNNMTTQHQYNQIPMNTGYQMQGQQRIYGNTGGNPVQHVNNQPYMMNAYNQQQQSVQQRINPYHMSNNQNHSSAYQYAQFQQQMAQKQIRNPPVQGSQMYMQQRNLTPEQYAYQQRLHQQSLQQIQMQHMQHAAQSQNVLPMYIQQTSVAKSSTEQKIQRLEVPEHYYETQTQREERECNSSHYYPYDIMNDMKKIATKAVGVA